MISVCLYLRILSSYLLTGLGRDTVFNERVVTTAVIGLIAVVALTKGLQMLERLEEIALWVTMLIMVVVLACFATYDLRQLAGAGLTFPAVPGGSWWYFATILGGTLITVQGFETSRYLGEEFDADTRIRSCRLSQIIADHRRDRVSGARRPRHPAPAGTRRRGHRQRADRPGHGGRRVAGRPPGGGGRVQPVQRRRRLARLRVLLHAPMSGGVPGASPKSST